MNSTDIVFDFELKVPLQQAWGAWTDSVELEKWLAVKAKTSPVLGGPYELFWEPETPNQNSTIGCKVTALVRQRLIAFTWKGPVPFADLMNTEPAPTWVVVAFEEASPETTVIHFRHSGWGTTEPWRRAREWQENAWRRAFSELEALLKG